jgi:thiol-disulfide isomerase/thioredoxin
MKPFTLALISVAMTLLAACATRPRVQAARDLGSPLDVLRAYPLHTFEGRKLAVGEYDNPVVLIAFWASWCEPCLEELQRLEVLRRSQPSQVGIIAANVEDLSEPGTAARANATVARLKPSFQVVSDRHGAVAGRLLHRWDPPNADPDGDVPLPFTVLLNGQGHMVQWIGLAPDQSTDDYVQDMGRWISRAKGADLKDQRVQAEEPAVDPSQIHILTSNLSDPEFEAARPRIRERLKQTYPSLTEGDLDRILRESRSDR